VKIKFNIFLFLLLIVASQSAIHNLFAMDSEKYKGKAPITDEYLERREQEERDAQIAAAIAAEQDLSDIIKQEQDGAETSAPKHRYHTKIKSELIAIKPEPRDPSAPGTSADTAKKESASSPSDPCFVANIPAYVPSDSEGETDTEEEEKSKYQFSEEDFIKPPFEIDYERRGRCLPQLDGSKLPKTKPSRIKPGIVESLSQKLSHEAFIETNDQTKLEHLVAVVGLNRPRSLSARKNRVLEAELAKPVDSKLTIKWFALFWDFPWKRVKTVMPSEKKPLITPLTYEEVESFYKQLKRKNPKKARQFRREAENNSTHSRRRMVPYRSIRELIKNHPLTRDLVNLFRINNTLSNVYLFFCDADTILFNGCFSVYTQMAQQAKNTLHVMTSGYLFDSENKMIRLACELDMNVREATAKYFPQGVYYPEPSFCILILPGYDFVTESFEDGKADYEAPQESPIILKQISLRKNGSLGFAFQNPLHTKTPDRATTNKAKTAQGTKNLLVFSGVFDGSTNKFINWTMHDLTNITKNSAQSHAHGRSWAINVLNGLKLHSKDTVMGGSKNIFLPDGTYFTIKKQVGSVIRDIAISLLSRLFCSFDPISQAGGDKSKLITILSAPYAQPGTIPPKIGEDRAREKDLWAKIDGIASLADLKKILSQLLLNPDDVNSILSAAESAGRAIHEVLSKNLSLKPQ
jgi:hypothetical protein